MKKERILVINPGSTSTKVALYNGEAPDNELELKHSAEDLKSFESINDQLAFRQSAVEDYLEKQGVRLADLSAIATRAGVVGQLEPGAYLINETFADRSLHSQAPHPANLAPVIGYALAKKAGIRAYAYDAVCGCGVPDKMYTITGVPEIERAFLTHVLNSRAVSIAQSGKDGRKLEESTYIVTHLGGGITTNLVYHGRILDFVGDDEGGLSPERSGGVPVRPLVKLCYSGKFTEKEIQSKLKGKGGILAYLGTNDIREVEQRIDAGDGYARLIFETMAMQIARDIASLAPDVCGRIDKIILTGGIARSERFTDLVKQRVSFLAPVVVIPGAFEMEALAGGVLRVLRGEEQAHVLEPESAVDAELK